MKGDAADLGQAARRFRDERDRDEHSKLGKKLNGGEPRPFAPIDGEAPPPGERFKPIDWNDVAFDPDEQWMIEDILPLRGLGLVFGIQGSFKSFVTMSLALAVMLGQGWAGKRVERGRVLYVAAEGGAGYGSA